MEADIIVTCPYNPAHRIRKFKLMSHILKCKKTSKPVNKTECPLDMSHIVDRDHLHEHIASCTSIGKLMDIGYTKPNVDTKPPIVDSYNSTENWEEEPEVPSYDPMEVSAKKPVLRCVSGLSKSEKKKFKENERMRMANLKGFCCASEASSSTKDTVQEVPLRPPRDTTSKVSQDDFDKSTQKHSPDTSVQTTFVSEFHNSSFHSMLYDELAPEDDNLKHLEQTLRSTDGISLGDYFPPVNKEKENFPISDQNQEIKVKETKTETDATSELFTVDNRKKEEDKCIASTSGVPNERVTDKLLALLKDKSDIKKVQPEETMEKTIKIDQINKDSDENEQTWDFETLSKLNERLAYLANIQNAAAEESAQLLHQMNQLKLREESASRK